MLKADIHVDDENKQPQMPPGDKSREGFPNAEQHGRSYGDRKEVRCSPVWENFVWLALWRQIKKRLKDKAGWGGEDKNQGGVTTLEK